VFIFKTKNHVLGYMMERDFFVWLFEDLFFDRIRTGQTPFDVTFSAQEQVAYLPNRSFKWCTEINHDITECELYYVRAILETPLFQDTAKEYLAFWNYTCQVGMKDTMGLRCYIKIIKGDAVTDSPQLLQPQPQ